MEVQPIVICYSSIMKKALQKMRHTQAVLVFTSNFNLIKNNNLASWRRY